MQTAQSVFLCCFCKMLKSSVNLPICRRHQATADLLYFFVCESWKTRCFENKQIFLLQMSNSYRIFLSFPNSVAIQFPDCGVTTNKNLFSLGRFQLKYFTRNDLFPLRFQIIALTGIYTGYLTFQHCHLTFETCINFELFKPRYL